MLANARLHRLADPESAARRAIATVEMADAQDRDIRTYSKGMKQRIKMATAIVHDPTVLLLDEPFNGMDPRQRLHLMDLLHQLGDQGRTILFSSHILEEVEQIARPDRGHGVGRHAASGDFREIRRLMTQRPHQYTIRSEDDRALASAVIADASTAGVELVADGAGGTSVHVQALDFAAFTHALPRRRRPPRHPAAGGPPGRRVPRVRLLLPGGPLMSDLMDPTVARLTVAQPARAQAHAAAARCCRWRCSPSARSPGSSAASTPTSPAELEGSLSLGPAGDFGIAIMMPLLGLIAGTGAIGPEIDEGSIVYLLAKPLNRYTIVVTKLAVAIGVVVAVRGAPGPRRRRRADRRGRPDRRRRTPSVPWPPGVAYAALFLMLAVITRNAVVVGLIYALIWESLVGGLVPGAQTLSVQQWALAVVTEVLGYEATLVGLEAAVSFTTGMVGLVIVTVGATAYAGRRLQTLRLHDDS